MNSLPIVSARDQQIVSLAKQKQHREAFFAAALKRAMAANMARGYVELSELGVDACDPLIAEAAKKGYMCNYLGGRVPVLIWDWPTYEVATAAAAAANVVTMNMNSGNVVFVTGVVDPQNYTTVLNT